MGLRHYDGPRLPAVPEQAAPLPPPPRPPVPSVERPVAETPVVPTVPTLPAEFQGLSVEITNLATGISARGDGPTLTDALLAATTAYENAQPVQALVWADGSPVKGLAQQVLLEGIEMLGQLGALDEETQVMIRRLQRALGEEEA